MGLGEGGLCRDWQARGDAAVAAEEATPARTLGEEGAAIREEGEAAGVGEGGREGLGVEGGGFGAMDVLRGGGGEGEGERARGGSWGVGGVGVEPSIALHRTPPPVAPMEIGLRRSVRLCDDCELSFSRSHENES